MACSFPDHLASLFITQRVSLVNSVVQVAEGLYMLVNVCTLAFKMTLIIAVLLCLTAVATSAFQSAEPRGIQLRVTQNGLDYSEYGLSFSSKSCSFCLRNLFSTNAKTSVCKI